jgi:hypothetical protein
VADTSTSANSTTGTPSGNQTNADKELMWIDHSATSAYRDTIYAIWHAGSPTFVSRRTPAGTWSAPFQLSGAETAGISTGSDVKTNANGEVFAFWPSSGNRNLYVAKSTDGGGTFTALTTGAPTANVVTIANTIGSFQIGIPAFNGNPTEGAQRRRPGIYPSGGAYRNGTRNLVYAAWMDLHQAGCTAPDGNTAATCKTRIWFNRSTDGGAHWETARMINNPAGLDDQFNPRLTVDEATGGLTVAYFDTVLTPTPNRLQAHVYAQHSANDGVSWSAPVQVTNVPSDETAGNLGIQYGDYSGISAQSGTVFPSWTDHRGGIEEIWTDRMTNTPTYQGYHDGQDCRTAWGWAWDQVVGNSTRINVDVYDGSTLLGSTSANLFRGDLQGVIGDGQHAFNFTLPASVLNGAAHSIQVRYGGTNTSLSATPRTCASLFTTQVPETNLAGSNYENSSIFTSSVSGFVVAIKYYKAPGETGTHVGNLWDDFGNRLATVTFSGESASGWQTQFLPTRVAISANTRYRVSYGFNSVLSKTNCGATTPTFTNGPLSFVGSSYGTPNNTFPGTGSCGSYFFADVVFTQ